MPLNMHECRLNLLSESEKTRSYLQIEIKERRKITVKKIIRKITRTMYGDNFRK